MLCDSNSIKMVRQTESYVRFSVLNSKVSVDNIGPHDFVESCHRIYTSLKKCMLDWTLADDIHKDDFDVISGCVEVFFKYSLMPFLSQYHKKLWKRHDVPRVVFYDIGCDWSKDVKALKQASESFINNLCEVVTGNPDEQEFTFMNRLVLLKYVLDGEFSEEAWVEWNNAGQIVDKILLDFGWEEYENWENDVNYNAVENLSTA